MALSAAVVAVLAAYVLAMGLTFYWCVIADPTTSPTAKYITRTLPDQMATFLTKMMGTKGTLIMEQIMEKLLAIIYLTVVIGSYVTMVWVAYPKARASTHVANYHLILGHVTCIMAITSWFVTMMTNPGIITQETLHLYDHFPYDDLLYVPGRHDPAKGVPRLPRSKYDRLRHHQHVARFDHYCGWVASTIGEENYRWFLLFVLAQLIMCSYALVMISIFFWGEIQDYKLYDLMLFDRIKGTEHHVTSWIVLQFFMDRHACELVVWIIVAAMTVLLTYFIVYHAYITSRGMTTNEHYKWGQVRRWHASQVQRYQKYKRDSTSNDHPVPDGEVGCPGGETPTTTVESNMDDPVEKVVSDPGAMPKNIYDVGFVENWKQVIFPISIRKKKEAAKGIDKSKTT